MKKIKPFLSELPDFATPVNLGSGAETTKYLMRTERTFKKNRFSTPSKSYLKAQSIVNTLQRYNNDNEEEQFADISSLRKINHKVASKVTAQSKTKKLFPTAQKFKKMFSSNLSNATTTTKITTFKKHHNNSFGQKDNFTFKKSPTSGFSQRSFSFLKQR